MSGKDVQKFKGYKGLAGGVMKALAGFYLVFFTDLFKAVKAAARASEELIASGAASSAEGVAVLMMKTLQEAYATVKDDILGITLALALWIIGTLMFSSEWRRLVDYWPWWARKAYGVTSWLLRLVAVAGGALTAYIVSYALASGSLEFLRAVRISWILSHLYAAPLLIPVLYTLTALKYPPPGARKGLVVMALGALFYAFSIYSVITAFRPMAEVTGALLEAYRTGLGLEDIDELAVAALRALEVASDRFRGVVLALSAASILYTAGFAVIAFTGSKAEEGGGGSNGQ